MCPECKREEGVIASGGWFNRVRSLSRYCVLCGHRWAAVVIALKNMPGAVTKITGVY